MTIEKTQDVVYVKEIQPPINYQADPTVYPVDVNIGKTSTKNVLNERTYAKIHLIKEDAQTGANPQGDATLEGAVYGLYARENIVHPDGATGILHKAGDLVATLKTDKNGDATIKDLYLGKYFVKEIQAPEGYLLDETEHDVECSYEGGCSSYDRAYCKSNGDGYETAVPDHQSCEQWRNGCRSAKRGWV